jgi:hypothetical protein
MTSVAIISRESVGDFVAVTFEVSSSGLYIVKGKPVEGSQYEAVRSGYAERASSRSVVRDVIYMREPFSESELEEAIARVASQAQGWQPSDLLQEQAPLQERCFVNGGSGRDFYIAAACPEHVIGALTDRFPGVDTSAISLISTPSYNEVLGQNVISTFLWEDHVPVLTIDGMKLVTRSRKFCLESGGIYDRLYLLPEKSDSYKFLPASARLLAKSVNTHAEGGLRLPEFFDVYFGGDDKDVQRHFGLPPKVGAERTYYGATVAGGDVVRVKQYCYDAPGVFHDWDGAIRRVAQAHGIKTA